MSRALRLEPPDEPSELRLRLRDAALEMDEREGSRAPRTLAEWLWERWKEALVPAGMDREVFGAAVDGYHREIWFWLLGDRGWDQLMSGLIGRLTRRMSTGQAAS